MSNIDSSLLLIILVAIGGALYLIGTLLVTVFCNVPRNDALAAVVPDAPHAAGLWSNYIDTWTIWNHVRSAAAFAATAAFILALVRNLAN